MKRAFFLLILTIIVTSLVFAQQEARLLRFPTIHSDKIVFSYAGDLYTVFIRRRRGTEVNERCRVRKCLQRFSPDGKWIAFTGQYDGNTEVYVMPAEGGVPKRLTFTATLDRDDVSDRMGPEQHRDDMER